MLAEDWRLPILLWSDDRRTSAASGGDVVEASFPAVSVVRRKALVMTTIEFRPCLMGADFLSDFVLAVAQRSTA